MDVMPSPQVRARLRRAALALGALVLLGASYVVYGPPWSGMGARRATPEAALLDALSPGGWLDQSSDITLLQVLETPEGRVAVFTGGGGGLGTADAKPSRGRWTAHGMMALGTVHDVTCWQEPSSGTTVMVAAGPMLRGVASVIVVDGDGKAVVAATDGLIWEAASVGTTKYRRALALDTNGAIVQDTRIDDCRWPQ